MWKYLWNIKILFTQLLKKLRSIDNFIKIITSTRSNFVLDLGTPNTHLCITKWIT